MVGSLEHLAKAYVKVGWFIPAYVQMGGITNLARAIDASADGLTDTQMQNVLGLIYSPEGLAAMVVHRYSITPVICDYKETIAEAVEAHCMGLHHVAVAGLAPVIEGAGRQLAANYGIAGAKTIRDVLQKLGERCRRESTANQRGEWEEIASMMDSFTTWTRDHFYRGSSSYPSSDGTNRNGILHGTFRDQEFGSPLNFYKVISAVDFLTFVSSVQTSGISWFAPSPSPQSGKLAIYYRAIALAAKLRPSRVV